MYHTLPLFPSALGVTFAVRCPSSFSDFSMFEGNVIPLNGTYLARNSTQLWVLSAGDTQWRYSNLISE